MKYYVNENCIGCGLCASTCPDVFSMTDSGVAKAVNGDAPEPLIDLANEAMQSCPVAAIELL